MLFRSGAGDDLLYGGAGDDVLSGGDGDDRIFGQAGNDTINGQGDDDKLFGGAGADTLRGQDGANLLNGGAGKDILFGSQSKDRFFSAKSDRIVGDRSSQPLEQATDLSDLKAWFRQAALNQWGSMLGQKINWWWNGGDQIGRAHV